MTFSKVWHDDQEPVYLLDWDEIGFWTWYMRLVARKPLKADLSDLRIQSTSVSADEPERPST